jgi:hypothetical protein
MVKKVMRETIKKAIAVNFKEAITIFTFTTTPDASGYFTVIASCEQKKLGLDEKWVAESRSVKVLDIDVDKANTSAYNALLHILEAEKYNLLEKGQE